MTDPEGYNDNEFPAATAPTMACRRLRKGAKRLRMAVATNSSSGRMWTASPRQGTLTSRSFRSSRRGIPCSSVEISLIPNSGKHAA